MSDINDIVHCFNLKYQPRCQHLEVSADSCTHISIMNKYINKIR